MSTNIIIGSGLQVNKTATFTTTLTASDITINNTLTVNTATVNYSLNATNSTGNIILEPQQIEFFNNSPGSNFNIGCAGGNFYVYNGGTNSNVLEINYTNDNVNINNVLTVNTATVTTTLTASDITINNTLTVNTAAVTTTLTASNAIINTTLTVNENVTINATTLTFCLSIVGNSNTQAGTQVSYNDGTTVEWMIGPNFSGGRGGGVGLYDFLFNNPYLGYNQIVIQHDNAIVDINSVLNVNQSINVTNTLTANSIVATSASISDTLTVNTATISTTLTANSIVATSSISIQTLSTYSASLGDDATGIVTLSYLNLTSVVVLFISNVPTWSAGTYQSISITNPPNLSSYPLYNLIALQVETTTSTSFQFVNAFSSGSLTVISYTNVPSGSTLTLNPFSITYQVE